MSFGDLHFTDGQTTSQIQEQANASKTLPRSLRYRSFNYDLRSAPTKRSQMKNDSRELWHQESGLKSTSDNGVNNLTNPPVTDLVPDFSLG